MPLVTSEDGILDLDADLDLVEVRRAAVDDDLVCGCVPSMRISTFSICDGKMFTAAHDHHVVGAAEQAVDAHGRGPQAGIAHQEGDVARAVAQERRTFARSRLVITSSPFSPSGRTSPVSGLMISG